jgi:hypothetical protein
MGEYINTGWKPEVICRDCGRKDGETAGWMTRDGNWSICSTCALERKRLEVNAQLEKLKSGDQPCQS